MFLHGRSRVHRPQVMWGQRISSFSYKTIHQIRAPLVQPWLALITSLPYPQTQSHWLTSTDEFWGTQFSPYHSAPGIPKLMSLLHETHIYFIPTAAKILTDSSINSIKSEVSSKYHLNQIWVKLEVWLILRQNSSLAVNLWNQVCASKLQWWDRRITSLHQEEIGKKWQVSS